MFVCLSNVCASVVFLRDDVILLMCVPGFPMFVVGFPVRLYVLLYVVYVMFVFRMFLCLMCRMCVYVCRTFLYVSCSPYAFVCVS